MNCSYCYATARKDNGDNRLNLKQYKQLLDEAVNLSEDLDVILTGGEPLLNPNCFDIAEYAKKLGCKVNLLTNGTLINESNVFLIKEWFDLVKVSIDGSTKEIHEANRGNNSYNKAKKGIELLQFNNVNYLIAMTVTKQNINDITTMASIYGSRLNLAPLFNIGNAKKSKFGITGEEYFVALSNAKGVNTLSYCESSLDYAQQHKICKCAIGDAEISITETGDVYPCHLLHIDKFYSGNVLINSLSDIYNNSQVLKECRQLTVDNIKGCSKCYLRYVCGGACRARAFYECGKIDISGKFCEYEKKAFNSGIIEIYSENALKNIQNNEVN